MGHKWPKIFRAITSLLFTQTNPNFFENENIQLINQVHVWLKIISLFFCAIPYCRIWEKPFFDLNNDI